MLLYRVLAAHKLWELLRKDKDGLVEEDKNNQHSNLNVDANANANANTNASDEMSNDSNTRSSDSDHSESISLSNDDEKHLSTIWEQAIDDMGIKEEAGNTVADALDLDDEEHNAFTAFGSTLNITPAVPHHAIPTASQNMSDVTLDIPDDPNTLKEETSALKDKAKEAAEKATAWWTKFVKYWQRPGYKGARKRVFWQLLDLELFHILYVNIVVGMTGSSAPQRMLKVYEAVFEAAPQVCSSSLCFSCLFVGCGVNYNMYTYVNRLRSKWCISCMSVYLSVLFGNVSFNEQLNKLTVGIRDRIQALSYHRWCFLLLCSQCRCQHMTVHFWAGPLQKILDIF